jgi:rhodanese-related sulfurtransferase
VEILTLCVALVALLLAWLAFQRAGAQARAVEEAGTAARRAAQNAASELGAALEVQRKLLARTVAGERLAPDMVLEGRLWRDVSTEEARALIASEPSLVLLDVRTSAETRSGIIPGARLIPIDELESRARDLPADRALLVYCAGGGRSAAACELLAQRGWERLHNLEGGFQSWTGERVVPS